jgi:nicotinamide mononucleotide (NMN) deamidase PncC
VEAEIRKRAGELIFGVDGETLEEVVGAELHRRGWRVVVIDQGAGGLVIERLAAAASSVFAGGVILGEIVTPSALGATLSSSESGEKRACEMASRVREWVRAEVGLAILIEEVQQRPAEPAFKAFVACLNNDKGLTSKDYQLGGDLASVRVRVATLSLDFLRRSLK